MDKRAVISKILSLTENKSGSFLSNTGGPSWLGQSSGLHSQVKQAISAWINQNDSSQMLGLVHLLETVGDLSAAEAERLVKTINQAS